MAARAAKISAGDANAHVPCDGIGDTLIVSREHDGLLDAERVQLCDDRPGALTRRIHHAENAEEAGARADDHDSAPLALQVAHGVGYALR